MTPAAPLLRDLTSLLLVLGAAAGGLRGLDLLPQSLGEPVGGRPFATVGEVERRLGERLARPAYFPQTLAWPPVRIRLAGGRPAVVVLALTGREGGRERLLLGQSIGGVAEIPERLWPGGVVIDQAEVGLGAASAALERLQGEDGQIWHQLSWERWDRRLVMRSSGPPAELLAMARSLHREGP